MKPSYREGDYVRPSRAGGDGKCFKVDGFVADSMGKLYAAISHPLTGKGAGCFPARSLRPMTAQECDAWKRAQAGR